MDLNKHIVTNDTDKPFHSNGYARVAVGDRVGSVGGTSFNQRLQIDRNRRIVYGYNRSAIGNVYSSLRSKPAQSPNSTINTKEIVTDKPPRRHNNTSTTPSSGPSHQSYNPYI